MRSIVEYGHKGKSDGASLTTWYWIETCGCTQTMLEPQLYVERPDELTMSTQCYEPTVASTSAVIQCRKGVLHLQLDEHVVLGLGVA